MSKQVNETGRPETRSGGITDHIAILRNTETLVRAVILCARGAIFVMT